MNKILLTAVVTATAALAVPAAAQTAPKINYVSQEMVQQVPKEEEPKTGDLPICKKDEQTNCINSWEANKTGNRPINYWPGRPASEIKEPLPLNKPND